MSPYMQAYEAGVKLAQLAWMSKVADPENMSLGEPNESLRDDGSSEPEAPAPMSSNPEPTDNSPGDGNFFNSVYNIARGAYQGSDLQEYVNSASDAYQGSDLQEYVNSASDAVTGFFQDDTTGPGSTTQAPAQQAPAQQAPAQQAPAQQAPAQQAPAQQAPAQQAPAQQAGPRFDYQAVNQDGMVDQDARFNVQAGNYRKQFNRFREQFGGGEGDAFKGLTYKDFAGALGNRGLRVGDSLSANDIMTRLQAIREDNYNREQGMPVASRGAGLGQLEIQNRRGSTVNRGSLAAQLAAAQRARTNMPQSRPGQFANTQLSPSSGLVRPQTPQLTLGSNSPGVGSSGFQSPLSAAKATSPGLNLRGDFRLNTQEPTRSFNEYED